MNSKTKNYVLLLFSLICLNAFGQNPYYYSLSKETALPDTEIYSILEEKDNTFWIAANRGLYHFDGVNYTHFTHPKKKGLSVFGLKYDSKGKVWCNTISGQFFYVEDNQMQLYIDLKKQLNGNLADFVFYEDQLYVFSAFKIIAINKKKELTTIFESEKRIGSPHFFHNCIYFAQENETYKIEGNKIIQLSIIDNVTFNQPSFSKWFSFKNELFLYNYDQKNNKTTFFKFLNGQFSIIDNFKEIEKLRIISINEYDNELYFSTSKGILTYRESNKNILLSKKIFENIFITDIRKDKNDSFWISSINEGILVVPNLDFKYTKILDKEDYITCIEKINNEAVFIGTFRGNLIKYNFSTQKRELIINPIQTNKITSLKYISKTNTLYISAENNVFELNLNTNSIYQSNLGFQNAKALHYSKSNNALLYAGFDRASMIYLNNESYTKISLLDQKRSYSIIENKKTEDLIVSYTDETKVYSKNGNQYALSYKNTPILSNQLTSSSNGITWVSTYNSGILGFNNKTLVKEINLQNGLSSTLISKIIANENLWILTDKSVQLYDIKADKLINYIENPNEIENKFIDLVELDNELIIATNNSLLQLPKENVFFKYQPQQVEIKSITANSKPIEFKEQITLEYYENQLNIEAYSKGYFPKSALEYQYKLSNSENSTWKTFKNNTISFEGLAPNKYSLQIRAKNVVSNQYIYSKIIKLNILSPFWKRSWFISSLVFFLLLLSYLFYRYQIKLKEKENTLALKQANYEKELVSLQLENLKSQMNPHFIFNALNSIQEYIILNEKNLASTYLAKFAQLIRAYLEHSSQGLITLEEEMECLNSYLELEKLRFEEKLQYEINAKNINNDIKIPTMLIQPYVENALKHGLLHKKDNRILSIKFFHHKEEKEIECVIVDNGVGRAKAAELNKHKHKSFATKANLNRLELLNKERDKNIGIFIEDLLENNIPSGTKVTLRIPIL